MILFPIFHEFQQQRKWVKFKILQMGTNLFILILEDNNKDRFYKISPSKAKLTKIYLRTNRQKSNLHR